MISERHFNTSNWISDNSNDVAIVHTMNIHLFSIERVIALHRLSIGILCYLRPSLSFRTYLQQLSDIETLIRSQRGKLIILAGGFNANLKLWGSNRDTSRGIRLKQLTSALDLRFANTGNVSSCVRPQRKSVVDLTWISPGLCKLESIARSGRFFLFGTPLHHFRNLLE